MDFWGLVVREIHARCPRNSRKPCKTLSIRHLRNSCFFVVLLMFSLIFPDFSWLFRLPGLVFCISATQCHAVIPRSDAESRWHSGGTHCTASGCGIQAKRQSPLTLWRLSGFRFSAEWQHDTEWLRDGLCDTWHRMAGWRMAQSGWRWMGWQCYRATESWQV